MREFGIEMELLCLARDGPPPILCSPFRLGLRNETFSWSLQFSRVLMVQRLSFVFTKLSRVLTSQFTAVYCYAGCQAAWTKMTTVQLGLTWIEVLLVGDSYMVRMARGENID